MRSIKCLFLSFLLVVMSIGCGKSVEAAWQEKYDLGMQYLVEANYEEAILAFTAAIEIDPKKVDTYFRLEEIYIELDDIEAAIEILQQGYKVTQEQMLLDEIGILDGSNSDLSKYLTDDMISLEEFTIAEIPFYELSLEEGRNLLPESEDSEISDFDVEKTKQAYNVVRNNCSIISVYQQKGESTINELHYDDYYNSTIQGIETEIRGISTGDSMESVLEKIGISSIGAKVIAASGYDIMIGADTGLEGGVGWIEATDLEVSYFEEECKTLSIYFGQATGYMHFINNRLVCIVVWIEE